MLKPIICITDPQMAVLSMIAITINIIIKSAKPVKRVMKRNAH